MLRSLLLLVVASALLLPSANAIAQCNGDPRNLRFPLDGSYTLVDFCGDGATGNRPAVCPDQHNDDDSALVALPFTFDFYGTSYTSVYVNNNGNLSFGAASSAFSREPFPFTGAAMIAPFWSDVDTGTAAAPIGNVWMRFFDGDGDGSDDTLVVTWDNVGYYNGKSDLLNTYQVAISDGLSPLLGSGTNTCFSYDNMCYTTGDASSGTAGFGGVPATVGANRGDGVDAVQFGRFDHAGADYDGPYGIADGVDYLDGRSYCFSTATTDGNLAPVADFVQTSYIVNADDAADQLAVTLGFLTPESGQTTTVTVTDPDGAIGAGLVVVTTAGERATVALTWTPTCLDVGQYDLTLTATDDSTTPATTIVTVRVHVICEKGCGWSETFAAADLDGPVRALAEFDDGSGLVLYAAGDFTLAGATPATSIAAWDGSSWSALGTGLDDRTRALAVFDDGGGAALYAGGDFTTAGGISAAGVARWNGSAWTALGAGLPGGVNALAVYDAGGGDELYAAGSFNSATGAAADYVARWDGAAWQSLGTGVDDVVHAMTVFGGALITGGDFLNAGGSAAARVAAWSGTTWAGLGSGAGAPVRTLLAHDAGAGTRLYAGGDFTTAGGAAALGVAEWNGTTWSALGAGLNRTVHALAPDGLDIVAGGSFASTGSGSAASKIARWDGATWSSLGSGLRGPNPTPIALAPVAVLAVQPHSNSNGAALFVGGDFAYSGHATNAADNVARWTANDPTLLLNPSGAALCVGDAWTLSVTASGLAPLGFQWRQDGVAIPGATNASYVLGAVTLADNGDFDCVISNTCGSITSGVATLFVEAAPELTSAPSSLTRCVGDSASFSVAASGLGTLTYQWRKDGANISGATGSTLTFPAVTAADAASYDVLVSDDCGTTPSGTATLTVRTAPVISVDPASVSVCIGATTQLTVTATGSAPLQYQWAKDGSAIGGATLATLDISPTTGADGGSFDVTVTNDCGVVVSSTAIVTILEAPVITLDPASATPCTSSDVTLTVAASGSAPLGYQWRFDGTAIPGATTPSLALVGVSAASNGNYDCVVTNGCGSATSTAADITAWEAPTITLDPLSATPCLGDSLTLVAAAVGVPTPTLQWFHDGLAVGGATGATLTFPTVTSADAGDYTIVATNPCGSATSATANIAVRVAPTITADPAGGTPCEGSSFSLLVSASGSTPLTYQWRKDGSAISGANSDTLNLTNVTPADNGAYDCIVTNNCGVATSAAATVTVWTPPVITTDPTAAAPCVGDTIVLTGAALGTPPPVLQWLLDGTPIAGATNSTLTLASTSSVDAGDYALVATNACGASTSATATVTVRVPPTIVTDPVGGLPCQGDNISLSVSATGSSPLSYQWRKDGSAIGGAMAAALTLTAVDLAASGVYDCEVSNNCGSAISAGASVSVQSPPALVTQPTSQGVCLGDSVTISVSATGSIPLQFQWRLDGSNLPGENAPGLTIPAATVADAGSYDCVITNPCGSVVSTTAVLDVGVPAAISTDPTGLTICDGDPASFTVVASGTAPISYQWRRNGTMLPGATSAVFALASATTADAGAYDCVATNACGTATSVPANLVVRTSPVVTADPTGGSECLGGNFTLTVTATGSTPLNYQWQRNGTNLAGATNATLSLTGLSALDTGSYQAIVTNDCGSTVSAAATFVVDEPPAILVEPISLARCTGATATLSVSASGTLPLSYQWFLDGSMVAGATSSSLTTGSVSAADAGSYEVVVTNVCGTVTSAPALLDVLVAPMITTQPGSVSACLGDPASLSVVATGSAPVTHTWRRDGVDVPGANSATLTISAVTAADDATYDVVITNSCGSTTSLPVTITVLTAPAITMDPTAAVVCEGDAVTLNASASGSAPSYQWRLDGVSIPGATGASLTLPAVTVGDGGAYDVVASNICGNATSAAANLTVNENVQIVTAPTNQSVTAGDPATFAVIAAGTSPLTYQWFFDGAPLAGQTTATLNIPVVTVNEGGSYHVEVTNVCGTAASNSAILAVGAAVPPDALTCCVTDDTVQLCWTNSLAYDAIEVSSNGLLLATLNGTDTCYSDMPGVGTHDYDVIGVLGGLPTPAISCSATVILGVLNLNCGVLNPTFASPDVELTWALPVAYDNIEVRRDGLTIATLPGATASYVDTTPTAGPVAYEVVGVIGAPNCDTTASESCSVVVPQQSAFRRSDVN
ncbi:MAG: immunoglobulin domain-containing protein, partial [Planctomycetota bacterium]